MKKVIALFLALLAVLTLTACGAGGEKIDVEDATELMATVWQGYTDDEKFPMVGGDAAHSNREAPDAFSLDDAAALDATFALPTDMAARVDDAASVMHMMNANTFTAVAFHVKASADVKTVTDALHDGLMNRQWLCGFPDKLTILNIGDFVISVFGNEEMVDTFAAKTTAAYASANVAYDAPIA